MLPTAIAFAESFDDIEEFALEVPEVAVDEVVVLDVGVLVSELLGDGDELVDSGLLHPSNVRLTITAIKLSRFGNMILAPYREIGFKIPRPSRTAL